MTDEFRSLTDDEIRTLDLVRALRVDPCRDAVADELSKRSLELAADSSAKRFTYNKLWWLCGGPNG